MKLETVENGWSIDLTGTTVTRIEVDYALALLISDGSSTMHLRLEQSCTFTNEGQQIQIIPEVTATVVPVFCLLHTDAAGILVETGGKMTLKCVNGATLVCDVHPLYEAWQIGMDGDPDALLVCCPGEGVALFLDRESGSGESLK